MPASKPLNSTPGFHAMRKRAWRQGCFGDAIDPDVLAPLWAVLLEQRLTDALLTPPIVRTLANGSTEVETLGAIRYVFVRGTRSVYAAHRHWQARGFTCISADVSLEQPLQGPHWVEIWIAAQALPLHEAVSGAGTQPVEPLDVEFLRHALAQRLWARIGDSPALRWQRRMLCQTFPLERPVLRLAWRRGQELTSTRYSLAWQRHAAEQRMRAQNPRLLGVLRWLIARKTLPPAADYGELRAQLASRGLSRAGWKALWTHGWRLLRPIHRGLGDRKALLAVLAGLANLTAAISRGRPLPDGLAQTLVDAEGVRGVEAGPRPMPARLVLEAWRMLDGLPPDEHDAFLAGEVADVLHWWYVSAPSDSELPPRAPWAWFRNRSADWTCESRLAPLAAVTWDDPSPTAVQDGYMIEPLRDHRAVLLEGRRMRHCLGAPGHIEQLRSGKLRVYSVRDAATGKPVATAAALARGRVWLPAAIRGFANSRPPTGAQWAAWRYMLDLNRQDLT